MAALIGLVVGALVGGLAFGANGAAIAGFVGFFIGAAVAIWRERSAHRRPEVAAPITPTAVVATPTVALADRLLALERRVAELERAIRSSAPVTTPAAEPTPPTAATTAEAPLEEEPASPVAAPATIDVAVDAGMRAPDGTEPAEPLGAEPVAEPVPATSDDRTPPLEPAPPNPVWAWFVGGNTLARVGVVLLFIGVGFLLKYAVERVYVPMSVRLAGVAFGGVVLLVLGWRLRHARRPYAMVLQGGGVGVLYLTVFAALRLYALLSPAAAFVLLLWISAMSSFLAVRQDALSLAVLAVAGGFLAPILTSTQAGDHVLLFSYYVLLNVGILGIAWFKAWRVLNLVGFAFTFIVGTLWGVTRYRPENFATTEPFLVLFFLFYVAIAVLYALRRSVEVRSYVDAGLVFGTPLVAAGLQAALVRDIEYAMAGSALAMGALYVVAARILWRRRREDIRLLIESFVALGVVFATLAIPLALDARWTAAAWAVEGAAIVWAGVRQARIVVRAFGLLLQFGAGAAFLLGLSVWTPATAPAAIPFVNSAYVGAMLVAFAGLHSAWLLQRRDVDVTTPERGVAALALAWGALWWIAPGWREIERFVPPDARGPALVVLLAATAAAFFVAELTLRWPAARVPTLLFLPTLLVLAAVVVARRWETDAHLFGHGGFVAWPLAVVVAVALLWAFDKQSADTAPPRPWLSLEPWHAFLFWLVLLLAAHETAWSAVPPGYGHGVWSVVPWGLWPALGIAAVSWLASGASWPIGAHRRGYRVLGAAPVVVLLALGSLAANVHGDGDPAPLPYVPFLNPLDIVQAIVFVACGIWVARVRREEPELFAPLPPGTVAVAFCVLAFVWINAMALRTIHFAFDVPYTAHALWRSTVVQSVLSLLWSMVALATMVVANRRRWRVPWVAGAALLGAVVVKLFAVELAHVGTVTRIVSFIGVGLLLLLIGYLAPVPPRRPEEAR